MGGSGAEADSVTYIDETGQEKTADATAVSVRDNNTITLIATGTTGGDWYYLNATLGTGNSTPSVILTGSGIVNLILGDGATLTAKSITGGDNTSLVIYGQSGGT